MKMIDRIILIFIYINIFIKFIKWNMVGFIFYIDKLLLNKNFIK